MSRCLRYIPPGGALLEITSRTMQRRLLLRPSPALNDVALGVLARAARLASVLVHAFAFLSNHYHLLVWVADAQQLAQFMNLLNSNLAREGGRIARWREKFWGRRYQAIVVSEEEAAQVGRLQYEETGKPPLGREAACRQDPHHEPNRIKKGPAPLVHAVEPAVRRTLRRAYYAFRDAYRYAALRLRSGATDIEFPAGAFPPPLPVRAAARGG